MIETSYYKLKKPGVNEAYSIDVPNANADTLDEALRELETGKAGLDPATGKVSFEQLPDIDCGSFDGGTVAEHDRSPYAHPGMAVDGNSGEHADASQTLEEHMENPTAHQNLELDGNGT